MEPQYTIGPEDHLSRLPPELLARIFELARDPLQPLPGPLSRALLCFDRAERFKDVFLFSFASLCRLAAHFQAHTALPHLVKTLLYLPWAEEEDLSANFAFDCFFSSLSRLSSLGIGGKAAKGMVNFVLSPAFASSVSPLISSITLGLPTDAADPWNPAHFSALAVLPRLSSLSLHTNAADVDLSAAPVAVQSIAFPHIQALKLGIPLSPGGSGAILPLIHACPALRALKLSSSISDDFYPVIDGLTCPTLDRLRLVVDKPSDDFPSPSCPVDHLLPRFPALSHLHLGCGTFNRATLRANLDTLPALSFLEFGEHAEVNYEDLSPLVQGRSRLRSLKRLKLDGYQFKRGWSVSTDGGGQLHQDHAQQPHHLGPGWSIFSYEGEIEPHDVPALLEAATASGIEVTGTVVDTAHIVEEYHTEAINCLVLYGLETGGFDELRAFLGDEEAERVLAARGF